MFATGSQTCGEVWTPPNRQLSRLGETNQEHCVVYNMVRLADYLFRWTGEAKYADYVERNIWNGFFAQGHWQGRKQDSLGEKAQQEGLVAYYLPLASGSQKKWGHKTQDFWCCHGTLVQANAMYKELLFYQSEEGYRIAQYFPFETQTEHGVFKLEVVDDAGEMIKLNDLATAHAKRPEKFKVRLTVTADEPFASTLSFRMPWWATGKPMVSAEGFEITEKERHLCVTGVFQNTTIDLEIPRGLTRWELADAPEYVAFLDGPVLLAGLTEKERILYEKKDRDLLVPREERKWSDWGTQYQTVGQPINFTFKPLHEIGYEKYTVYFPTERKA
jgi:DUF1680 family protein